MCKFVCLHAIAFCVGRGGDAVPFPVVWALGWNFPMSRIFARKWAAGEYQESTATPHMNIIKRNFHVGVLTI